MTTEDHAELPAPFRRMLEVSFPEGTPSHRAPTREEPSPC